MADELVVIGRGKMIDNRPVDGFVEKFTQTTVLVRTPAADTFGEPAPRRHRLGTASRRSPCGFECRHIGHRRIGPSGRHVLRELAPQSASLEQAFMSATGDSEEFVAPRVHASVADRQTRTLRRPPKSRMTRAEVAGNRRVRFEWVQIRTLRSTYWLIGMAVLLSGVVPLIIAVATRPTRTGLTS